jgi:hypothetical protein
VAGLRAPLTATLAGLPLFQKAWAVVAQERRWRGRGGHEAHSGRWRQGWPQGMACRQGEGEGGSQWSAEWAEPFLQRPSPWPQTRGSLQCRRAFEGQQNLPRP